MSDQAQGLHIHVENRIAQDLVYRVTRERMDGALERHPEIAARIGEQCFDDLDAPVGRLGGLNVPTPYARVLEAECIPQPDTIVAAVQELA